MAVTFNWINKQNNAFTSAAFSVNVGSTSAAGSNGTITAGDLLIAGVFINLGTSGDTITPPAGWTILGSRLQDSNDCIAAYFYKIAGASESGVYNFTFADSESFSCILVDYQGANTSTPIDAVSTTIIQNMGGTTASYPSISPSGSSDTQVLLNFSSAASAETVPSVTTSRLNQLTANSGVWTQVADQTLSASGATTGPTVTGITPTFRTLLSAAIAILPASGAVAFQLGTTVQTNGINAFALANKIHILSAAPATPAYSDVSGTTLGNMNFGIGNCFGAPGDNSGPPANMQLVSVAVTAGSVTANGTPTCWAVVDDANSRLLAWGPLTGGVAVTSGESWTLASFTIQVPVQ